MVLIFLVVGAGGLGGEAPQLSRVVWEPAGPPTGKNGRWGVGHDFLLREVTGGGVQWILGGDVTSGGD